MKYIAPSILSADFSRLGDEIKAVEAAGADWIHVDVMDGHFVPNITMGPLVVKAARKVTDLPLDVHLMIENPDCYIPDFARAGATLISVQVEACPHLHRTIQLIRESGCQPGAVLNPSTSLSVLEWVMADLDLVTIMSVNPGFGGQKFITGALQKVRDLRRLMVQKGIDALIEIDGGVNASTISDISDAGVDVFVAGSAIFESGDYGKTIETFRNIIAGESR